MNPIEAFLRRFGRGRSGASAVEFALILPLMLTLYLGTYEVTQGLSLDRQVKLNSSTVTNLVAQYTTISATHDMPDVLAASAQILAPYSNQGVTVVSLISIDATGKATVAWSQAQNGSARPTGQVVTVPTTLDKPSTVLVLGETSLPYKSPLQFLPLPTWNLYGSTYMAPRASTTINLTA
jgi:Flp pilus assembly protein TadG